MSDRPRTIRAMKRTPAYEATTDISVAMVTGGRLVSRSWTCGDRVEPSDMLPARFNRLLASGVIVEASKKEE